MRSFTRLMTILVILVLCYLTFPQRAYAYLDPGTGSLIVQVIIAALLGTAFTVKLYWGKIRTFFTNRFSKKSQDDEDDG